MSRRAKNDLIVRVRYQNPLPEPPCPPKLLNIPTTPARYAQPSFTDALFDARPFPMVVDSEFGMPLDLSRWPALWGKDEDDPAINPPHDAPVDPRDAFLFEHIVSGSSSGGTSNALPNVSWLRKTEYISKEAVNRAPPSISLSGAGGDRTASQPVDVSHERQLQLIEESFAAVSSSDLSTLQHPNKPGLHATEVFPILPDELTWPNKIDVYRFSERPGDKELDLPDPRLESAIIRPMKTEDEDAWLAYYLLANDDAAAAYAAKRAEQELDAPAEEEPSEFRFVRDYETMKVVEAASDWLVVMDDGAESGRAPGLYYKDVERRMWLRKRRVRRNDTTSVGRWDAIQLRHAPMEEAELAEFREALAEVQDPEYWARKALEAELDAEGEPDADAEGEADVDMDAEGEVEVNGINGAGTGVGMEVNGHAGEL